jgi:hypothetical protein
LGFSALTDLGLGLGASFGDSTASSLAMSCSLVKLAYDIVRRNIDMIKVSNELKHDFVTFIQCREHLSVH